MLTRPDVSYKKTGLEKTQVLLKKSAQWLLLLYRFFSDLSGKTCEMSMHKSVTMQVKCKKKPCM
jgi:hypothetical protein